MRYLAAGKLASAGVVLAAFACSTSTTVTPKGGGGASGQAGDASSNAGAGGTAGASPGIPRCESPTFDPVSQLVICQNGFSHRPKGAICGASAGNGGASAGNGGASAGNGGASAGNGGASAQAGASNAGAGGWSGQPYATPCASDADCPSGFACVCGGALGFSTSVCVIATCRSDADCGAGSYCAVGDVNYGGDVNAGFTCLRPGDECLTDADCSAGYYCLTGASASDWGSVKQTGSNRTCSEPPM